MRKLWTIVIIAVLFAIGAMLGIYAYNKGKAQDSNNYSKQLAYENTQNNIEQNIIYTSTTPKRTSPNATILEKQYFTGCDHLIKTSKNIPEELVNKTKEEVEDYYKNWSVDDFSEKEITIYRQKEGFCDQHYLIKEHNGVLGIYTLDEKGNAKFKEDTQIQTMYLTQIDLEKVKEGIEAVGDTALYTTLGDFE